MPVLSFKSPVGSVLLVEEGGKISSLSWGKARASSRTPVLRKAKRQLEEYFAGKRKRFDLPLAPAGSRCMRNIWSIMRRIGFGKTLSYGELAVLAGTTPRVAGQACAKNPIPILIPCHRVVAAGERLGGYSGGKGLETKCVLLRLEGVLL
jgi:methylated-DNA-[protein]-cysteine S-methyltransferase